MMHEPDVRLLATRLMFDLNGGSPADANDATLGSVTADELSLASG